MHHPHTQDVIANERTDQYDEQQPKKLGPAKNPMSFIGQEKRSFFFYFEKFLFVKGPDGGGIELFEIPVLIQAPLDKDTDMIEQIVLKAFRADAMGPEVRQDKIDLLIADAIHLRHFWF
jgi:hypothetical protein